jgi:hypothetical protein
LVITLITMTLDPESGATKRDGGKKMHVTWLQKSESMQVPSEIKTIRIETYVHLESHPCDRFAGVKRAA